MVYLLFAKRLFGLRGGTAADEALRERDMGWSALAANAPGGGLPVLSAQRPLGQAAAISATWRASVPQQPPTTFNRSSRPASAA